MIRIQTSLKFTLPSVIYTIILLKSVSVVVRKLQVAILARSPREMSQTVRIVLKHILHEFVSQFGLAIFLYAKNIKKTRGNRAGSGVFISMTLLLAMNVSEQVVTAGCR